MVTLISEVTSGGKRRSCNARCYNAKGEVCICVCCHANHGVGQKQATENTQMVAEELLKQGKTVSVPLTIGFVSQSVLPL